LSPWASALTHLSFLQHTDPSATNTINWREFDAVIATLLSNKHGAEALRLVCPCAVFLVQRRGLRVSDARQVEQRHLSGSEVNYLHLCKRFLAAQQHQLAVSLLGEPPTAACPCCLFPLV
jgi:hypothetical protein